MTMSSKPSDVGLDHSAQTSAAALAAKWQKVQGRVAAAAERAGREPSSILVVAVTKTHPAAVAAEAVRCGITDLGENYVQEMLGKKEELEALGVGPVRWHFIGHLQRNKAKYIVPFCELIHSVDSERLGREIDKRAAKVGRRQRVLIEVNVSGEESKFGVAPNRVRELAEMLLTLEHVELRGLMTMAPYSDEPEASRPIYRRLAQLAAELADAGIPPEALGELSMGMTQDFEVAIEEGATIVRIGTAIFGPRRSQ